MNEPQQILDRAAARLTYAEPRPDVRQRVLASIGDVRRAPRLTPRWAVAGAAALLAVGAGATVVVPRWHRARQSPAVAALATSQPASIIAAQTTAGTAAALSAGAPAASAAAVTKARKTATSTSKRATVEFVTPTALPTVGVDAIEPPSAIQPTALVIPQLRRNPIAPGAVTTTMLDENGSSRRP